MNNVSSPVPTTTDLIGFYARSTPDKVALRWGDNSCTFAQLYAQLTQCTAFLHHQLQAVAKDSLVAVASEDFLGSGSVCWRWKAWGDAPYRS